MKLEITKEWSLSMAQIEGDAEIGAGALSMEPEAMSDIPEDIMRAASEAWRGCWTLNLDETITGAEAIARAIMAERERAAKVADSYKDHADNEFNERVRRSHRGEKNLELAASAGAGMSHAARKIAAAIREGSKP